jgi:hypothetical protein
MPKLIVHRIERHVQAVEVEVDDSLPREDQIRQARQMVADGEGEDVGELDYHSTDDSPENWSVYADNEMIA